MKLSAFITLHALLAIAAGITFALYSPLALNFFGIIESVGGADLYWFTVSFARLFGAALFGLGFVILSLRKIITNPILDSQTRRSVLFALLLSNLVGLIVALTQQVSIWGTAAGWVITGVFFILLAGCGYYLIKNPGI